MKFSKDYGFGKLGQDEVEIIIDKNGDIIRAYCWREEENGGPTFWEAESYAEYKAEKLEEIRQTYRR